MYFTPIKYLSSSFAVLIFRLKLLPCRDSTQAAEDLSLTHLCVFSFFFLAYHKGNDPFFVCSVLTIVQALEGV